MNRLRYVVLVAVVACFDRPVTAIDESVFEQATHPSFHSAATANGAIVSTRERDAAEKLGHAIGAALKDHAARQYLKNALAASAVREHKIH